MPALNASPDLRVYADLAEPDRRAAEAVAGTIKNAARTNGICSLVLAGGSTPRTLYSILASQCHAQIPWSHVHVFWGDERYVPPDDSRSNYRMARETLLDHVPCPLANIHKMPTHCANADVAADPAAGLRLGAATVVWWADRDAAAPPSDSRGSR